MYNLIITPDHPDFAFWLTIPPPTYTGENALVTDSQTGLLRQANLAEFREYIYGGEGFEVMQKEEFSDDLY